MEKYKRILTIQDISCVGQCSLTVALPIISSCGIETSILPTSLLSNHTASSFVGFSNIDLSFEFDNIFKMWDKNKIDFDCIYTGYLGDISIIDKIISNYKSFIKKGGKVIVDPAMADNGKLYPAFDNNYVNAMKKLTSIADILLPNITEACLLTDTLYPSVITNKFVNELGIKISKMYKADIVITGVPYSKNIISIPLFKNGKKIFEYKHKRIDVSYHGTGDVFSSVFTGIYLNNNDVFKAIKVASTFTYRSIKKALTIKDHSYGVPFEQELSYLTKISK